MDPSSAVLIIVVFLVGWVASGFIIKGPEIFRQFKARRRAQQWRGSIEERAQHRSHSGNGERSREKDS
jgi:hypothetical protein